MSQNQQASFSAGFSHEKIETNNFLMIVLILVVIAIGGLVEIVPLFFQKSTTEAVKGVEPYTATQLIGRDVYIRDGLLQLPLADDPCPFRAETLRYGHYFGGGGPVRVSTTPSNGAASAQVLTCIAWAASTAMNGIAST